MPSDNHLPSTDHLLSSLQCETPTQQIVEAEQDSGQPLRDEYCSSPAAQYHASDSMPPMGGFSSTTRLNLGFFFFFFFFYINTRIRLIPWRVSLVT